MIFLNYFFFGLIYRIIISVAALKISKKCDKITNIYVCTAEQCW